MWNEELTVFLADRMRPAHYINEGKTILNKEKFQPVGCVEVF
jgi:hypothetical protein